MALFRINMPIEQGKKNASPLDVMREDAMSAFSAKL
jgi:hypothetical protein